MIEKETPETERPVIFLRESDEGSSGDDSSNSNSVRARFEKMIREVQDSVCTALVAVDGGAKFKEDVWSRPGGGGGISRVLQDGDVFEKASVNVSVVYGTMPPEAYRAARPVDNGNAKPGPIPFFAAGFGIEVRIQRTPLHQPYILIIATLRLMLLKMLQEHLGNGGLEVVQKGACDKFDASFYPRFKKWCDAYFYIKAGSWRIFFDDLNDYDQEMLLSFSTECANSVIPAYIPILEKRKDTPFNDEHKACQQLRRGRYVEFNLVYDRGTTFGLKTGGRIESILVSLPLTARWEYDHQPVEGSEEWKLLDVCINPKEWLC
ncbi:hypothetical protein K7X08_016579 [Anisodus acutangulus]|uniref:coproporphyrinogen oxidase n=1 Tax=Anisodus acutangulus TaxID=402998 RepID=A0A9Q1LEF9_9SOLA|nr:hypothetical protein K7X08_016579 [Anisodus acutangulus]